MNTFGKSDIGLVRSINQDDIKLKKINDSFLWAIVCDGMGGVKGGDIASSLASSKISEIFNNTFKNNESLENYNEYNFKMLLEQAVSEAGKLIYNTAFKDISLKGMGTTVVACIVYKETLHVAHVGDSRAYVVNHSGINQITIDHSVVQEMVDNGKITKDEAMFHPQKNIITRALGINENVLPDYNEYNLQKGDSILLCTDGLTNELNDKEIYNIFAENEPEKVPDKLIAEANSRRGADNITIAVIS